MDSAVLNTKYGITFDDSQGKVIQLESELGKRFSAKIDEKYKAFRQKCMSKLQTSDIKALSKDDANPILEASRSILARSKWAVYDKQKFKNLVGDLTMLVDGLSSFTMLTIEVETTVANEVKEMRDINEIVRILVATQRRYKKISETANIVVDTLTSAGSDEDEDNWKDEIDKRTIIMDDEGYDTDVTLPPQPPPPPPPPRDREHPDSKPNPSTMDPRVLAKGKFCHPAEACLLRV